MRVRLLLAVATFGLMCAAGPVWADDPPTDGAVSPAPGLTGHVVLGVRCPVPLGGDDGICPQPPLPSTLTIRSADGLSDVAQIATDQDGQFSIDLSPGDYLVDVLAATSAQPLTQRLAVSVGPDGPTPLTVIVPSGAGGRRVP